MNDGTTIIEIENSREAIIQQIFAAYRQAGFVFQKAQDDESRDKIEIVRHDLDMALRRLFPLSDYHQDIWREVRMPFYRREDEIAPVKRCGNSWRYSDLF